MTMPTLTGTGSPGVKNASGVLTRIVQVWSTTVRTLVQLNDEQPTLEGAHAANGGVESRTGAAFWPAQSLPLCGLLFLQSPGQPWYVALVWESGRAEVWSPPLGSSDRSWTLLQCVELCHGPRARVASVCCSQGEDLLWCEERATSNHFSYCLCRRSLRVSGCRVALGTMAIVLHHSPFYTLVPSPSCVFMIPNTRRHPILVYALAEAAITLSTLTAGVIHAKALAEGDMDYKKLTLECIGVMTRQADPETQYFATAGSAHLLVMTAAGRIHLLQQDGTVRHVIDLEGNLATDAQVKMAVAGDTLVCTVEAALHLIDIRTGRLVAKQLLNDGHVFLMEVLGAGDVQLLTQAGVYKISRGAGGSSTAESALLDMVYEEACKYYQRRSLSSAKLTVQSLKENGMFQAPITLSAILGQKNGKPKDVNSDLLSNIDNELQSFQSLELLKSCIVNVPGAEVAKYCDELVDLEITRLLQAELDRESLMYINSLFTAFPKSAWMSIRNNFQFQRNGDGKMVVRATADLWKKVLSPLPLASRESSQNGVYPLFEVVCQSLCAHKPKWLPEFVQHAQDCSGLYWNFTTKEHCEGAPLYKRALAVLNKRKENTNVDLEVEILLRSGRPQAIIQAIHTLIRLQRWSRVMEETLRYSQLNPLIKKDVFITLLVEFVKHRQLDPYAPQLCQICPEDLTATDILRIVLQNTPKTPSGPPPFSGDAGAHLTVGLLKPLLNKVLQKQVGREETFLSPTFPPTTPQRTNKPAGQIPTVNGEELSPTDIYATKAL
ncbi:PREDICTED: Hermansky-Pudlak syndrome 6 protein [Nanorana parkeri]|uniref:Hermansky-Pudlak syndrome 6 protein n=1 Tax=Nanorana parkeri TaxID=125878 RepID=UPI000854A493|nr:PREDICTED: Hermansky-Pudlak syndrome 6 protein [Nanorana parkeri]